MKLVEVDPRTVPSVGLTLPIVTIRTDCIRTARGHLNKDASGSLSRN